MMKRLLFITTILFSMQICAQQNAPAADTTVYTVADTMPEFPGGTRALMTYLSEKIEFKGEANDCSCSKVVFKFVVDKNGKVISPEVTLNPIGECLYTRETIESLKKSLLEMPDWKPGRKDGKSVNVRFYFPLFIRFN